MKKIVVEVFFWQLYKCYDYILYNVHGPPPLLSLGGGGGGGEGKGSWTSNAWQGLNF